ncbi:hypothetical protein RMCBS344292_19069 [Rhizopus microsporus]|nr:hypothetical protein RMCBS344292_19069 [Rhizopus microsporus]
MDFTPKQLHYLKREMITKQLDFEISSLVHDPETLFLTAKKYPLLSYIFHHMIIKFPLLKQIQQEEFWGKCQTLLNEFNKIQLDNFYCPQHSESSLQKKLIQRKLKKALVFAYCASIKTVQGKEESIKIFESTSSDDRHSPGIEVNIVAVRRVKVKKALLETSHAEFIIETRYPDKRDPIYVNKRHRDFRRLREQLKRHYLHPIPVVPHKHMSANDAFYREHDRLALRAYLHELIQHPIFGKCQALHSFLMDQPTSFVPDQDCFDREKADKQRFEEQEKSQEELNERVKDLHKQLDDLKKEILQPGGLINVFDVIKHTRDIQDLPPSLKKAFEWGRINFAFALRKQFTMVDTAADNLNNLKRTHGLMPYRTISMILKLSNPMSMVKSILDLFLAQPFGSRSLFQRILISNLSQESKSFQKAIEDLEQEIGHANLCEKVYNAVHTSKSDEWKDYTSPTEELLAILRNNDIKPILSDTELSLCDNNSDEGKKLIKHLYRLWESYAKQKEHDIAMELVFQGVTGDILKECISVFYEPLAQVYKAADISTTIRHISLFIDDLLNTIEQQDKSIQSFIDLVKRHEQRFYDFVYNVHTQDASDIFNELIKYVDTLFTFMFDGLPGKIDINHSIEQAGITTPGLKDQLMSEVNSLCEYRYKQKMYRFERAKKKIMLDNNNNSDSAPQDLEDYYSMKMYTPSLYYY